MHGRWLRWIVVAVAASSGLGCVSLILDEAARQYYSAGPEAALEVLDSVEAGPADRFLVDLERSVPLTELGRYEDAIKALADARELLDAGILDPADPRVTAASGAYFGEYHERVLAHTLEAVDQLALQRYDAAAAAARRALARAQATPCDACEWGFTRWTLAAALEAGGKRAEAIDVLAEAAAEASGWWAKRVLGFELDRLTGLDSSAAEVFAPPPLGEPQRELVVIALLGAGPYKVADREVGPGGRTVGWSSYVDAGSPVVATVAAEAGPVAVRAVELSDVGSLARRALRARFHRWRTLAEADPTVARDATLRYWSTLPSSIKVLRIPVPRELSIVTLSFRDGEDTELGIEPIPIPVEWHSGPLFVVRRLL